MSDSHNAAEVEVIDLTELTGSEGEDGVHDDSSSSSSSESDVEEIVLDQQSRAQLHSAVASASENRLRRVLVELIEQVPEAERIALNALVTRKRKTSGLASRWETCEQCEEEFDGSTRRSANECTYHLGDLEPDYESFVDWDEDVHGPINSEENQRQYPGNFLWNCCEKDGLAKGCTTGKHVSSSSHAAKRQKL